jgi:hypothetical protein
MLFQNSKRQLFAKLSLPADSDENLAVSFVQTFTRGMGKEISTEIVSPVEFKVILETGMIVSRHLENTIEVEVWK